MLAHFGNLSMDLEVTANGGFYHESHLVVDRLVH